ncbi:MAG TPA: hypothetical protein VKV34_03995 [Thermoleophilia bacterium]|nr:hypothetical protein [Thermoleophilia bacterium]
MDPACSKVANPDRRLRPALPPAADATLVEIVRAVQALPHGRPSDRSVAGMLAEGRGTSSTKHRYLHDILAARFPESAPQIVHRVAPTDGLVGVHRYLTVLVDGRRLAIDATLPGRPWDGRSSMPLACGPGIDYPSRVDPDAEKAALEKVHCAARPGRM